MPGPGGEDSVGERLRHLRRRLGLSQEQLARRLGVSFATVNRWESGRTQISAKSLATLAELEAGVAADGADGAGGTGAPGDSTALPVARSSFVGRERELAELAQLLLQARLITLIGPGGVGKSRLAAQVLGRRPADDADVVFVPLEQVRYPRTLASALASRLQVHDQQSTPLIQSLQAALSAGKRKLLLLDGAERLADQVAELAGELLDAVPELRIVVTSRVVLGVPGEVCWTVPPLGCPAAAAEAADIVDSDAVRLFIARASERLPDFRASDVAPGAIAELCRRLDGLPLAIELIAGWVGTLSVREILQQRAVLLDSEPAQRGQPGQPGGRRLADVLQVSYDLLTAEQQRRLAMLSVLAGPFRIADVQAVLDVDAPTAIATTRALVDSSWLMVTRGGEQNVFSLLETIATFTALQLEKSKDGPAARRRHALHFASVAAESELELAGPDAAEWAARLEAAVPDLDLTMHWAGENGDIDLGLHVSSALWRWWLFSGRLAVGRDWLGKFLTTVGDRADEVTGRAYCAAAVLAAENGDYSEAVRQAELAMAIFGPLGLKTRMTARRHRHRLGQPLSRQPRGRQARLRAGDGTARGAWRPAGHVGGDQQPGPARAGRRQHRSRAAAVRAVPGHQARVRRAAVDRPRPRQPGGRADQNRPVGRRGDGADRGRRAGGREPAADRDHRLQPGRAGRAPAGLGAGHREVRGGDRGVAGRRAPARRDRGDDRARPGARAGRRSAGRRRPAARRAGAGGRDRQPAAARGGGGCPGRDHPARRRHRRPAPASCRPSRPCRRT